MNNHAAEDQRSDLPDAISLTLDKKVLYPGCTLGAF